MRNLMTLCILGLFGFTSFAQTGISMQIDVLNRNKENFKPKQLFESRVVPVSGEEELVPHLKEGIFLEVDKSKLKNLLVEAPETMELEIPSGKNASIYVRLYKNVVTGPNFEVKPTIVADKQTETAIHYHGIVAGNQNSVVGLSLLKDEVIGMIGTDDGNLSLGKMAGRLKKYHILYKEADLLNKENNLGCAMKDDSDLIPVYTNKIPDATKFQQMAKCVEISIETDYPIYAQKGAGTNAYIQAVFNLSASVYAIEFVTIQMSELVINYAPTNYKQGVTGVDFLADVLTCLNNFQTTKANVFQGDLAMLMFYGNPNGGVAAGLNGFCNPNRAYSMCVGQIESFYNNLPAFSNTIYLTTHELGHLMGSPHTHACYWNTATGPNTAIDGCAAPETYTTPCSYGPPITPGGGTVMSYCGTNINFNNSFGLQPGDLIYANAQAANCTFCPGSCNLAVGITPTHATCSSNGAATAFPSNGQPPFQYSWSNGQNTQTINNLLAGTYTVNVTDVNGCPAQASVTIVKNCTCSMSVNITPTHTSCIANGFATAYPVSGNGPFSYSWSNGQNTQTAVNLVPGTYSVNVTDVNFCTATQWTTIIDDCNCPPVLNLNQTHNAGANELYQAEITINETDKINAGATINCKAGTRIILKPGFEAKPGSYFRGNIENCPP